MIILQKSCIKIVWKIKMFNSYLFVLLIKVIVTYKCVAPPEGEHINTDTGSTSKSGRRVQIWHLYTSHSNSYKSYLFEVYTKMLCNLLKKT